MKENYLFIGSHPDDIEFGCGGTVSKLISQGHNCIFIIATNGDQGSLDIPKIDLLKLRKKEAQDAAKLLKIKTINFLNLPDGLTQFNLEHKINLIELIRKYKPKSVFIHSKNDHHPDHKIIHNLCISAISSAQGPWFKEAKGEPVKVQNIYGYEVWNPISDYQMSIDITAHFDNKIAALSCHKSQVENYPYIDAVTGLAKYRGAMVNGSGLAEVFEVIRASF
jgi:LmbE family N-acetylglucosaminyl deacetylase